MDGWPHLPDPDGIYADWQAEWDAVEGVFRAIPPFPCTADTYSVRTDGLSVGPISAAFKVCSNSDAGQIEPGETTYLLDDGTAEEDRTAPASGSGSNPWDIRRVADASGGGHLVSGNGGHGGGALGAGGWLYRADDSTNGRGILHCPEFGVALGGGYYLRSVSLIDPDEDVYAPIVVAKRTCCTGGGGGTGPTYAGVKWGADPDTPTYAALTETSIKFGDGDVDDTTTHEIASVEGHSSLNLIVIFDLGSVQPVGAIRATGAFGATGGALWQGAFGAEVSTDDATYAAVGMDYVREYGDDGEQPFVGVEIGFMAVAARYVRVQFQSVDLSGENDTHDTTVSDLRVYDDTGTMYVPAT